MGYNKYVVKCDICGHDINGELLDDTRPDFAVKLNNTVYCAYCFKTGEPKLWLSLGGWNMLGTYTLSDT